MIQLKNDNFEITIDHPLANYNFSRFDWTGKIIDVKFRGSPIGITERTDGSPEDDFGKAFYNEFGMDTALGFEEAAIGDWFHKIGIGLLKKDSDQYDFTKRYEVKPAEFKVDADDNKVLITCTSELVHGYAYELKKEITLNESGFSIQYYLRNTGVKLIATEEYCHNFIGINKELISSSYKLTLPFEIQPAYGDAVNPDGHVLVGKQEFKFDGTPKEPFFYSNLSGNETVNAQWELRNLKSQIGISEKGSFKTNKINLWGWEHVISPELFHKIHLKPGQNTTWSRTFKIFELG